MPGRQIFHITDEFADPGQPEEQPAPESAVVPIPDAFEHRGSAKAPTVELPQARRPLLSVRPVGLAAMGVTGAGMLAVVLAGTGGDSVGERRAPADKRPSVGEARSVSGPKPEQPPVSPPKRARPKPGRHAKRRATESSQPPAPKLPGAQPARREPPPVSAPARLTPPIPPEFL